LLYTNLLKALKRLIIRNLINFSFLTCLIAICCNKNLNAQNWLDSAKAAAAEQDYYSEIKFYRTWLKDNQRPVDPFSIDVMLKLAYAYRLQNNMKMCFKAVGIARKYSRIIDNEYLYLKSTISLAEYTRVLTKLDEALEILNDIDKRKLKKYPDLLARFYNRKAAVFNQNEDPYIESYYDSTLANSFLSLEISKKYKYNEAIGTSFNEIAFAYERKKLFEQALPYYDSAAFYLKDVSFVNYINTKANSARLQYHLENYNVSIDSSKKILKVLENLDMPNLKFPIYYYIGKSYLKLGDTLKAYENKIYRLQNFIDYLESVKQKEIFQLSVEFEVLDKNKTIEINQLKLKKEEQQKKLITFFFILVFVSLVLLIVLYNKLRNSNKKLTVLLKENQFLLGESNHRIKNNLQLIIALIALEDDNLNEKESLTKLNDITSKIESIASLHQKLYNSEDKNMVDLKAYLDDIISNLKIYFAKRKISLSSNIEEIVLDVDKCMYLGLLTTELIINTLKHAFEQTSNGIIEINVEKIDKKIIFTYSDNGKGTDKLDNMTLINILSDQLKGEKTLENRNGFYYQLKIKV
jgi:two-component sensor histidine kinase